VHDAGVDGFEFGEALYKVVDGQLVGVGDQERVITERQELITGQEGDDGDELEEGREGDLFIVMIDQVEQVISDERVWDSEYSTQLMRVDDLLRALEFELKRSLGTVGLGLDLTEEGVRLVEVGRTEVIVREEGRRVLGQSVRFGGATTHRGGGRRGGGEEGLGGKQEGREKRCHLLLWQGDELSGRWMRYQALMPIVV
jgi:hypothetical protein